MTIWTSRRERFERLHMSELDFENLLLTTGDQAFANWTFVKWKKRVYTPDGRGVEADAVLLSRTTDDWVVCEIELASHSISGHVRDQLERLATALYGQAVTDSIAAAAHVTPEVARRHTRQKPDFLCIADDLTDRLSECCAATGFHLAVLQPYRSGQHSALRETRMPKQYQEKQVPAGGPRYILQRSPDAFFGHVPFLVPDSFPVLETLRVEYSNAIHEMSLTYVSGSRLLFTGELASLDDFAVMVLYPTDLTAGLFRCEKDAL
jgi:hypothetical protein